MESMGWQELIMDIIIFEKAMRFDECRVRT